SLDLRHRRDGLHAQQFASVHHGRHRRSLTDVETMMPRPPLPRRRPPLAGTGVARRRGFALGLALVFTIAIGALATTAIILSSNATMMAKAVDRQRDMKYAAEAALQIVKSRITKNAALVPDSGDRQIMTNDTIYAADDRPVPGITVNAWVGPSGSTTGQFGNFVSVVAQAEGARGAGFVRRLEMTDETFAKYAYWSNSESVLGTPIYFQNGDQLWGPVWSNDVIHIGATGATFHDVVGTAQTISGASFGTFLYGYAQNQPPMALPADSTLTRLAGYAATAGYRFTPPTNGDETTVLMRVEFVATDLNGDHDSTDANEGFFRVYQANTGQQSWLRGDWPGGGSVSSYTNCGDWHAVAGAPDLKFFPASVHPTAWFHDLMVAAGMSDAAADSEQSASISTIMQHPGARCYLGGDPHLVAVSRTAALYPNNADRQKGGDDTTFTPVGAYGSWLQYSATPSAVVSAVRADARYLFPLYRGFNPQTKGVVYFGGTVGVSGTVRGHVTVYVHGGDLVLLDDLRYADDPAQGQCADALGLISGNDIVVADNAINTPQFTGSGYQSLDDSQGLYVQAVLMALNTSFRVQNYGSGPSSAINCQGRWVGRGCLYLTGGVIQQSRGPVGASSGQ
ncbi:MAG: hypothetical protein ACREN3_05020, partial [Gemmatimonadaceae bacterium]